jgi:hypothetical protein
LEPPPPVLAVTRAGLEACECECAEDLVLPAEVVPVAPADGEPAAVVEPLPEPLWCVAGVPGCVADGVLALAPCADAAAGIVTVDVEPLDEPPPHPPSSSSSSAPATTQSDAARIIVSLIPPSPSFITA